MTCMRRARVLKSSLLITLSTVGTSVVTSRLCVVSFETLISSSRTPLASRLRHNLGLHGVSAQSAMEDPDATVGSVIAPMSTSHVGRFIETQAVTPTVWRYEDSDLCDSVVHKRLPVPLRSTVESV